MIFLQKHLGGRIYNNSASDQGIRMLHLDQLLDIHCWSLYTKNGITDMHEKFV